VWSTGLVVGLIGCFLSLVGMVEALHGRWLVHGVLSLGQGLLILLGVASGYVAARRSQGVPGWLSGAGSGAVSGAVVGLLVWLAARIELRTVFVNASPVLFDLLSLGRDPTGALLALPTAGAVAGLAGALSLRLPPRYRNPALGGVLAALLLSVFQELLNLLLQLPAVGAIRDFLYVPGGGPTLRGVLTAFLAGNALVGLSGPIRAGTSGWADRLPEAGRRAWRLLGVGLGICVLALLPFAGGSFVSQVLVIVGLYALMGLGLNIDVGFAGLLDLGFVAFFAISAYTTALLTSTGPLGIAHWSFWAAVPVAVVVSAIAGVILGIPVLGIRGDYLAIATLGFGEIVRLLVLSDALRPWLGGSQGILAIPKPVILGFELKEPQHLYYLTLVASAMAAFAAWRLQNSKLGRAWMAIREDEDVAEALGIDLVKYKLLAFGLGASLAGIGGAIFAVMLGSVFPHSFNLLISINVLALIIVGGLGSIPGVILGSLVLIGLPELLREFGEFRFLVYGAALVAMMLLRPEGLWPAAAVRRELRAEEGVPEPASEPVVAAGGATVTAQGPTGG
jgi:branched-chain amino acid transport system permease protein